MRISFLFIIFMSNAVFLIDSKSQDSYVPLPVLVSNFGYKIQFHNVITEDNYILEMHRIFKKDEQNSTARKKSVLMMHGLIGSSADWVITGPNRSLALILVDKGFDVWLGNNRGNTYSRNYSPKLKTRSEYWNFSWHELGIYDLPAMINYILNNTNEENLLYTCFSEGCTQAFVMGSLKPEYNKKIQFAVALSPAAYTTHLKGTLSIITPFNYIGMYILEKMGHFLIFPASFLLRMITDPICKKGSLFQHLCMLAIFSFEGIDFKEIDREHLVNYLAYTPASASTKQFIHYGFGSKNPGTFRQYDYGKIGNLKKYNLTTPPEYPLENVNFPIAIYHGLNDYLATPEDVDMLVKRLPNVVDKLLVTESKLNHFDLLFAQNIRQLVYNRAIRLIDKYATKQL